MKRFLIREVGIYTGLLILLALLIHPDLFDSADQRFALMFERGNYLHPFIYTFISYLFVSFIKYLVIKVIHIIRKIKNKNN